MNLLLPLIKALPSPYQRMATYASSFLMGLVAGIIFNYVLYRLGLPSKPFIYVAF
ncbi:MAG TPA: hypothetical protein VN877_01745 [Opitutaceae bacterium]|nr:hypothetical protein [Opitutaceae bacterium]